MCVLSIDIQFECIQNAVCHSYQLLSVEMSVPTDSKIRVHSFGAAPCCAGQPLLHKHAAAGNSQERTFTQQTLRFTPDATQPSLH